MSKPIVKPFEYRGHKFEMRQYEHKTALWGERNGLMDHVCFWPASGELQAQALHDWIDAQAPKPDVFKDAHALPPCPTGMVPPKVGAVVVWKCCGLDDAPSYMFAEAVTDQEGHGSMGSLPPLAKLFAVYGSTAFYGLPDQEGVPDDYQDLSPSEARELLDMVASRRAKG